MSHPRTILCHRLSVALAALLCVGVVLSPLHAQTAANDRPDVTPPMIEFEPLTEAVADRSQVFSAQVADDRALESVSLHYRRAGRDAFRRALMDPIGSSGFYSVTVPTDVDDLRAFEYYLQAIDEGGNRTVFGFAFDPLRRELLPVGKPTASATPLPRDAPEIVASSTPKSTETPAAGTSNRRWWAIALSVVAVGAVAALASDSGGGDNGPTAPLRVDLQEP